MKLHITDHDTNDTFTAETREEIAAHYAHLFHQENAMTSDIQDTLNHIENNTINNRDLYYALGITIHTTN